MWLTLLLSDALACGQTTHIWTALDAREHLPPGELRDFLYDPEVEAALISGAMFPDGGYSPLTQHPYGEASHWEPFQLAYAARLRAAGPPYTGDAAKEVAFLLGMVAHGIGDQLYDSNYLYRSQVYDAEGWALWDGADTPTDVVYASLRGPQAVAERWVPYDALGPVFAAQGVPVDRETMALGMASLDVAVLWVGNASDDPDLLAEQVAQFPWATAHLDDPAYHGSPADIDRLIALYWLGWWERLQTGAPDRERLLFGTWPATGAYAVPRGADDVESMLAVLFATALVEATIEAPGAVTVEGPDGPHPIEAWMYYREGSNVLNLRPLEDWAEDAEYRVVLHPGITTIDGWTLDAERVAFTFSTGPAPKVSAELPKGCATGGATPGWAWIGYSAWLACGRFSAGISSARRTSRCSRARSPAARSSTT